MSDEPISLRSLSVDEWEIASKHAQEVAPTLPFSTALAAAFGFFFGGLLAMLTLMFAGLPTDIFPNRRAISIMSVICSASAYFFVRSFEKAHFRAKLRIAESMMAEKRYNRPQGHTSTDIPGAPSESVHKG